MFESCGIELSLIDPLFLLVKLVNFVLNVLQKLCVTVANVLRQKLTFVADLLVHAVKDVKLEFGHLSDVSSENQTQNGPFQETVFFPWMGEDLDKQFDIILSSKLNNRLLVFIAHGIGQQVQILSQVIPLILIFL